MLFQILPGKLDPKLEKYLQQVQHRYSMILTNHSPHGEQSERGWLDLPARILVKSCVPRMIVKMPQMYGRWLHALALAADYG